MAKKDKMVAQEVDTPEFLVKDETSDVAVAVEEQVDPSTLFVDKNEGEVNFVATASEGVSDEYLPHPISRIWLKSPGGVEYLIQAEDLGLLVIGNGKAVVLCGSEQTIPPVQEELVADPTPPPHPNRQYTFKPKG